MQLRHVVTVIAPTCSLTSLNYWSHKLNTDRLIKTHKINFQQSSTVLKHSCHRTKTSRRKDIKRTINFISPPCTRTFSSLIKTRVHVLWVWAGGERASSKWKLWFGLALVSTGAGFSATPAGDWSSVTGSFLFSVRHLMSLALLVYQMWLVSVWMRVHMF